MPIAEADVRQGPQRDAILYSVGANADHGRARTTDDKQRAVLRLLSDPEWAAWSDREIARHCRVSPPLVATLRPAVTVNSYSEPAERIFTTRHGTTATMNTGSIGRRPEPAPEPRPAAPPPRTLPPITQPDAAGRAFRHGLFGDGRTLLCRLGRRSSFREPPGASALLGLGPRQVLQQLTSQTR